MKKGLLKYVIMGIAAAAVLVLIILGVRGCSGVSHKSPERVVEDLVEAGVKGKTGRMEDCYDVSKEGREALQQELEAEAAYYKAHEASKAEITECKAIYEEDAYSYVYIIFQLALADEQTYPCIRTYMVKKKDERYYVLPSSEIVKEMSDRAAEEYARFMETDAYKAYSEAYDAFIEKNPGYEEEIAKKLG